MRERERLTLEAELSLEKTVQHLAVLAAIRVVDTLVRAHNGCTTSRDGIIEGPEIQLV